MARSVSDIKTILRASLGGRSDADAETIYLYAINLAIQAIALRYDVPEAYQAANITFNANVNEANLTSSWAVNDVIKARNLTNGIDMHFVPIEQLDLVTPTTGYPRFYSRIGNSLLIRPTPANGTTIKVRSTKYFTRLTDNSNDIPIEYYESQLVAIATAVAWAAFEEGESATLWAQIADILNISYEEMTRMKKLIEGVPVLKEHGANKIS